MNSKLRKWPAELVRERIESATASDVEAVLAKPDRSIEDMLPLLSEAAEAYFEPMAVEAQRLTRWHFGRTIGLFVPVYLSNVCDARRTRLSERVAVDGRSAEGGTGRLHCAGRRNRVGVFPFGFDRSVFVG